MADNQDQAVAALPRTWVKYYEGERYSYRGDTIAHHGDVVQLSNPDGFWIVRSRSNGPLTITFSDLDTTSPQQAYTNRVEEASENELSSFPATFLFASHPLKGLTVDTQIVKRVKISLQALVTNLSYTVTCPNAIAATSTVPQSATEFTSVTAGLLPEGTLGFVDVTQPVSTDIAIRYGFFDQATNTVNWTGTGTISLFYENGEVFFNGVAGLPAEWVISRPVQTPDGAWKIDIRQNMGFTYIEYPETYYYGVTSIAPSDGTDEQVQYNEGFWEAKSLRVANIRTGMLFSQVRHIARYRPADFRQIIFTEPEQPDLPSLYGETLEKAYLIVAAGAGYFVWLKCEISDPAYTDFFANRRGERYTYIANHSTGVLSASQDGQSESVAWCTVDYGSTDSDGFFVSAGTGSLTVDLVEGQVVIEDVLDFPANWRFSAPVKQEDGNWMVTLTDASA